MRISRARASNPLCLAGTARLIVFTLMLWACSGDNTTGPPAPPPAPPAKLVFIVEPTGAEGTRPIAPALQVAIQDAAGKTVSTATNPVTVALGANPGGATLSGTTTVSAVSGIATFAGFRLDRPGCGYTLVATAGTLVGATSAPFCVGIRFVSVSAGGSHTCGVTTTGAAYCWGHNEFGKLGEGSTTWNRTSPVLVAGGLSFTSVSAGGDDTCGLTTNGGAYCWGGNLHGAVGDGTTISRPSPVPVGLSFAALDVGSMHTCGLTLTGVAYCWGWNGEGSLGDGSTTHRSSPVPVAGGFTFAAVSVGLHNCGLATSGAAYCWGYNGNGELGDGSQGTSRTSPVPVAGGLSFSSVSAGWDATCGLTASGAAYCWGSTPGSGTVQTSPVAVAGGLTFTSISTGGMFNACGMTTGGVAHCWGSNPGDGSPHRTTPVPVAGGLTFTSVSAGNQYACGVTIDGVAYCWGRNYYGQLGDGTETDRRSPVRVVQ